MPYSKTIRLTPPPAPSPPPPVTAASRAASLRTVVNPESPYYAGEQAQNVMKVIELYESGQLLLGQEVFVQNGMVVPKEETRIPGKPASMHEAYSKDYEQHQFFTVKES